MQSSSNWIFPHNPVRTGLQSTGLLQSGQTIQICTKRYKIRPFVLLPNGFCTDWYKIRPVCTLQDLQIDKMKNFKRLLWTSLYTYRSSFFSLVVEFWLKFLKILNLKYIVDVTWSQSTAEIFFLNI